MGCCKLRCTGIRGRNLVLLIAFDLNQELNVLKKINEVISKLENNLQKGRYVLNYKGNSR